MEGGNKGSVDARPNYWLDACEEEDDIIPCEFIGDFSEYGGGNPTDIVGIDQSFFGGIDHILDSIKNGDGLPGDANGNDNDGMEITPSKVMQVDNVVVNCDVEVQSSVVNDDKMEDVVGKGGGDGNVCGNGGDGSNGLLHHVRENNVDSKLSSTREGHKSGRDRDNEERSGKRARLSHDFRDERGYLSRGKSCTRDWDSNGRKRYRESEDNGWRERERGRDRDREMDSSGRRRECYNGRREGRDREWRDREAKGYWEREKPGSKEIVYRNGSYEAARSRDSNKVECEKNQDNNARVEKDEGSKKEKNLEERARHYQLEVLEQAKQKNTIAFLETGAGKTLIAVLLIKSIRDRLLQQNMKVLAVFLVPKVPLVYQVKCNWFIIC